MKISFIKLIDVSILPAILAVCFKFLGFIFAASLFNFEWSFSTSNLAMFPLFANTDPNTRILANTFSQVIMFAFLVVGCAWLLFQAHNLHETHIHPKTAAKLERQGLAVLITNSFNLYHRLVIWISLLWFTAFDTLFESYVGNILMWVSISCITIAFAYTYVLAVDIEKEESALISGL